MSTYGFRFDIARAVEATVRRLNAHEFCWPFVPTCRESALDTNVFQTVYALFLNSECDLPKATQKRGNKEPSTRPREPASNCCRAAGWSSTKTWTLTKQLRLGETSGQIRSGS